VKQKVQHIKSLFRNHSTVAGNYFFMTASQVVNILINLLLFPYLIRTLGKESYGTYVFIMSNVQLFVLFFASGFSFPAIKKISLNADNQKVKNQTISEIFTAKFLLFSFCAIVLAVCVFFIPFVRANALIYIIIFSMLAIGDMLFPLWYFQGTQKMSFIAFVNVGARLLSIPLIFIFVKSPADLFYFVIIISVLSSLGGVFSYFYLVLKEKIRIKFVPVKQLKLVFKDAIPFYGTSVFEMMKGDGLKFIVGVFWDGMGNVAVYDLAEKIVKMAQISTSSINTVIFPKAIKGLNAEKIKRIFRYETIIGLAVTFLTIAFGYWAVLILGGKEFLDAYPLTIALSFSIYLSLMTGCYVSYVFVPQNHYYFVSKIKLTAMIAFVVIAVVGLIIYKSVMILALAYTLSFLAEIIHSKYLVKKYRLL